MFDMSSNSSSKYQQFRRLYIPNIFNFLLKAKIKNSKSCRNRACKSSFVGIIQCIEISMPLSWLIQTVWLGNSKKKHNQSKNILNININMIILTWPYIESFYLCTTIHNDLVSSWFETWLIWHSWRTNQASISCVTIQLATICTHESCCWVRLICGLSILAKKIHRLHMSEIKY